METKLGHSDVIWMDSVDSDAIRVCNNDVEARRMQSDSLDWILELLDDLELHRAWVSRIAPDHECLVSGSSCENRLFHAGGHSSKFRPMERNSEE